MTKNPHPISRATERYGVRLTRTDMQALEAQCAALKPVKRLPDGSEVKIVVHGRAPLVAVWKEGAIVTFLPRENYDMGSAPDAGRRMAESCPMMRPSPLTSERGTISASSTLQMPRRRTPRRCTISRTRSTTAAATMPGAAGSVAMAPRRPRSDSMTIAVSAAAPGARPAIRRRRRSKPAQIEAGNYSKRHLKWQGLGISIETEAGGIRRSKPGAKRPWEVTMEHPYGHILGTKGADGDPVDVFVGPGAILGGKTTPSYRRPTPIRMRRAPARSPTSWKRSTGRSAGRRSMPSTARRPARSRRCGKPKPPSARTTSSSSGTPKCWPPAGAWASPWTPRSPSARPR